MKKESSRAGATLMKTTSSGAGAMFMKKKNSGPGASSSSFEPVVQTTAWPH